MTLRKKFISNSTLSQTMHNVDFSKRRKLEADVNSRVVQNPTSSNAPSMRNVEVTTRKKLDSDDVNSRVAPVSYTHLTLPTIYSV